MHRLCYVYRNIAQFSTQLLAHLRCLHGRKLLVIMRCIDKNRMLIILGYSNVIRKLRKGERKRTGCE
jgi:hypothetical protein